MNQHDADSVNHDIESARRKARREGITSATRMILMCYDKSKAKCASRKHMRESWRYLKQRLRELNLDQQGGIFRARSYCLDICTAGPLIVIMPDNCWYAHCNEAVLEQIIQQHLIQGIPVERYLLASPPPCTRVELDSQ